MAQRWKAIPGIIALVPAALQAPETAELKGGKKTGKKKKAFRLGLLEDGKDKSAR